MLCSSACAKESASAPALDAATDSSFDGSLDADSGGNQRHTSLVASFTDLRTFDLGVFGKNKDGTLHIEAHGDAPGADCTVQQDVSPGRTLTMGTVPTTLGAHELSAVLFDFEGALTEEPLLRSDSGSIEVLEYTNNTFWAAIDVAFPGGTIAGTVYAMHCPSIDEP